MLAVALALAALQDVEVCHPDPPFTLRLPAGFEEFEQSNPKFAFRWRRDGARSILTIQVLEGRIGKPTREQLRAAVSKDLPEGAPLTLHALPWKDVELYAAETTRGSGEETFCVFVVQVPLKPRAIQVGAGGMLKNRKEVEADLRALVASLDGPTSWLSPAQRGKLLAVVGPRVLGWISWAVYGLVWLFAFRNYPWRALTLRMSWMGAAALLLLVSVLCGLLFEGETGTEPSKKGPLATFFAGFACAQRCVGLWKRRRDLRAFY